MSFHRTTRLILRTLWPNEGDAVTNGVWPIVHAARAALIDDLTHLGAEQWEEPSLWAGWTVHDVVDHTAAASPDGFATYLATREVGRRLGR